MTPKQRLLAALRGQPVDRLPWSPNLAYWWQAEPLDFVDKGEFAVLKEFGCDPLIRGHMPCFGLADWEDLRMYKVSYEGCHIEKQESSDLRVTLIHTPKGTLQASYRRSSVGNTWFLRDHPIKSPDDYETLAYLFDHTHLEPDFANYRAMEERYGDEALFVPQLGLPLVAKTGFQSLLEFFVGTEQLVYDLYDEPDMVELAIGAMRRASAKAARINAASPAEVVLTWEDTSTTNLSPALYEKYVLPEINEWCDILHGSGKMYMQHACGHLRHVMPLMGASKIDGIESISPPPTGNIELWEARESMRPGQFLVGGIEPTVFLHSTLGELEAHVRELIDRLKGTPFILANSDSCPPGVSHEKFKLVTKIVQETAL